jgi:predicted acylesterase/phospholipase RssA
VADPLPIDVVKAMGADLTIAVSLQPALGKIGLVPPLMRRPKEATRRDAGSAPLHPGKLSEHLYKSGRKGERDWLQEAEAWLGPRYAGEGKRAKDPNVFEILVRTIDIMGFTNTLMMLASHPPTVLFEFDLPDTPTLDFAGCSMLIGMGRQSVLEKREELEEKLRART